MEFPTFLKRIQGDICGSIHPACGPFKYYMVLIDTSTRWSCMFIINSQYEFCEVVGSNNKI